MSTEPIPDTMSTLLREHDEAIVAAERLEHCAWCWNKRHPGKRYPEEWSSTICPDCESVMYAQLAHRKKEVQAC